MVDQNEINRQILKQLSQLVERISSMEQGGWTCKKSSDKSKIKNVGKVKHTQKAPQGRSVPQGLGGISNSMHPTFLTPGQKKWRVDTAASSGKIKTAFQKSQSR